MKEVRDYTIEEFKAFVTDQLKDIGDTQMLILKGHVIIEFAINCYLESISKKKDPDFFSRGFRFSDKVSLLEHFGSIETIFGHTIHEELFQLNDIRNDIAHGLNYKIGHLRTFLTSMIKKDNAISILGKDHNKLMGCLALLSGIIFSGYVENTRPEELKEFVASIINKPG